MLMQKYYSQDGTKWPEAEWYVESEITNVTQLVDPIKTSFWNTPLCGISWEKYRVGS